MVIILCPLDIMFTVGLITKSGIFVIKVSGFHYSDDNDDDYSLNN